MSSILRFVRSVSTINKAIHITRSSIPSKARKLLVPFNSYRILPARCLAAQTNIQNNFQRGKQDLDQILLRLDNDVRRLGIIPSHAIGDIISRLHKYENVTPTQGLLLLRCCGPFVPEDNPTMRTENAHKLWQTLEKMGVPFDLSHYNALLRLYVENEHEFSPLEFLATLEKEGIQPNRVTYQRLIHRFCQMGDVEGASKILEFMKNEQMSISGAVFQSLMLGHSRANDLGSALDMLELMDKSGHEVTVDTYAALAVAQAEHGDIQGVNSTIGLSRDKDQPLADYHMLEVIYALAVKGNKEHIPQFLASMKREIHYNKDCKTMMYRLMNAGHDDVAMQINGSMVIFADADTQSHMNVGLFFLKHLVKCGRSMDDIISATDKIQCNNTYVLENLLESAMTYNPSLAMPLMDAIVKQGRPLRPHYFWPLFKHASNASDAAGIYDVVDNMMSRGVSISRLTMYQEIVTGLLHCNEPIETITKKLRGAGINNADIVNSIVRYHISSNDLKEAVDTLSQNRIWLGSFNIRYLISALLVTRDYERAAVILGQIRPRNNSGGGAAAAVTAEGEDEVDGDDSSPDSAVRGQAFEDVVGVFLLDLHARTSRDDSSYEPFNFEKMLECLKERGLSISRDKATEFVRRIDGSHPRLEELMATLSSGTLAKVDMQRGQGGNKMSQLSVAELEETLQEYKEKDYNTKNLLTNLLVQYAKAGAVEKAEQTLQTLNSEHEFELGIGLHLVLTDMYYEVGKTQEAQLALQRALEVAPDAIIGTSKLLKVACLLVTDNKIEDAVELLEREGKKLQQTDDPENDRRDFYSEHIAAKLLNCLSDAGDIANVTRLTSLILSYFNQPSSLLLGPSVNVHLKKDDLDSAFEALLSIMTEHNLLPMKNAVLKLLINKEDTDRLQQLLDLGTKLHGEANSLLDLVVAFTEENRMKQALKIVQTPGLRFNFRRIHEIFEKYLKFNLVKNMEDFLQITASIPGLDRRPLYQYMLQLYEKEGDTTKALDLWTQMQDDHLTASDQFLYNLGIFLKSQDKPVPFTIPEAIKVTEAPLRREEQVEKKRRHIVNVDNRVTIDVHPSIQKYRELLQTNQIDEAAALYKSTLADESGPRLTKSDTLTLVDKFLDGDRLDEAYQIVQLHRKQYTTRSFANIRTLRRLLSKMVDAGDWDKIMTIMEGEHLNQRLTIFTNALCRAASKSGRTADVFDLYNSWLQSTLEENYDKLDMNFSKGGLLSMLRDDSTLLPKVEKLSEDYKSKGLMCGQSTLWAYHFLNNNVEKAAELRGDLRGDIPYIAVCSAMRFSEDITMAPKLVEEIHDSKQQSTKVAKGTVYSCWVDVLVTNGKPEEGLQVVKSALEHIPIADLEFSTLTRLKSTLAAKNIDFPYTLQSHKLRRAKKVSSSSSSDSD